MLEKKSVLARLLANENISVQQGNFQSASFDVVNRVLRLPLWKDDMSADVYDLFVGHEVGHALYTPSDPDVLKIEGVPHSYMNVVEDIRIEEKQLEKYPGLVSSFKRGYSELIEMDFFGTKDRDINDMSFMDRLNIKAKGRDLIEVEFSEEEIPYFKKAMSVKSFDDVAAVCKELVAWLGGEKDPEDKENESGDESSDEENSPPIDQSGDESADDFGDDFGYDESEESGESGDESEESGDESEESGDESDDQAQASDQADSSSDDEKSDEESAPDNLKAGSSKPNGKNIEDSLPEVETDTAQQKNTSSLNEGEEKLFAQGMSRAQYEISRVEYKEVLKNRAAVREENYDQCEHTYKRADNRFDAFLTDTKSVVTLMSKEFEMRKAAYRSARARLSTKGSIDVNKLHAYKYDDQLFKQVTTLADGKSHGIVMLVDYSGSMSSVLESVIKQTITLVLFCKRVNIPFQVYSFTTNQNRDGIFRDITNAGNGLTAFNVSNLSLIECFNNKMSKGDLLYAMRSMFYHSHLPYWAQGDLEALGSTPLNGALLASEFIIKDFLRVNPVEKLNFITLTDGHSNPIDLTDGADADWKMQRIAKRIVMKINGKTVELDNAAYGRDGEKNTMTILEAIKGTRVQASNFFICQKRQIRSEMYRVLGFDDSPERTKLYNSIIKSGVWVTDNTDGYDRRFVVINGSDKMSGSTGEFQTQEDATPAQITKAFKKFSGSKKGNRVLTQKFAELIA